VSRGWAVMDAVATTVAAASALGSTSRAERFAHLILPWRALHASRGEFQADGERARKS
jgi:hypothetical protein